MATQLIKHLKNCAENDAIYKPLEYQWGFDEQLIAKALQNVSMYFPHYSRHDESHSRQILVHIERLLGENLTKLTATDTWLLLEAAYLHDIGMVVTDEQLNKNFEEIKQHAESMKYSADDELLSVIHALSTSKENTASAIFASVNIPAFQTLKLLREIIADYYRKKHPEQAGKIITHPLLEIGLDSPRNELLPARFFKLLSKICEYHGADFEKVMDLPQQQVGMGTENCHPRFVACLLRLGDLLDLDDNRFCPVMMRMAGDLPDLSKAHHKKHLAIRHFRADPERIEIEAECPDYESYIETTKWFGWLRSEVQNQMSRWFEIVPKREFGLLPSVGDLKAHLKEWQVFSENQRPHFELDRDRIFELLQGAGLYECIEQAMRELLQNAVDATLIRIWREHGEDCQPKPESFIARDSAPRDKNVRQILDKYSIDVTIDKEKEEGDFNYWRITIADQGTGISRDDLKFMLQMGSSKKNSKRRDIIEKMPVWMKPSGIFGIGLHSIFLLTDEVLIETRSIDTGETLVIRLTNPTNNKEHGNVYFQIITESREIDFKNGNNKKFRRWDFSRYGCQLSFTYKTTKDDTAIEHQLDDAVAKAIENYDGLVDSEDFHIIKFVDTLSAFFDYSFITGNLKFGTQKTDLIANFQNSLFYESKENLEIIDIKIHNSLAANIIFFYRGQKIKDTISGRFDYLYIAINLLDDNADELLSINRNQFKSSNYNLSSELFNRISKAIQNLFDKKEGKEFYKQLMNADKARVAAEYQLQGWQLQDWQKKDEYFNWKHLLINTENGDKKIEDFENFDSILIYDIYYKKNYAEILYATDDNSIYSYDGYKTQLNKFLCNHFDRKYIVLNIASTSKLFFEFLHSLGFKSAYLESDEFKVVKISKEDKEPISKEVIIQYCKDIMQNKNKLFSSLFKLKRSSIPCLSDYQSLELKLMPTNNANNLITTDFRLDLISPRMLFPLARISNKITEGDLNILAKRVYKNRADKNTTEEQIRKKYQEFIAFLDDLMKDDAEWVKLRGDEFKPNLITDNN